MKKKSINTVAVKKVKSVTIGGTRLILVYLSNSRISKMLDKINGRDLVTPFETYRFYSPRLFILNIETVDNRYAYFSLSESVKRTGYHIYIRTPNFFGHSDLNESIGFLKIHDDENEIVTWLSKVVKLLLTSYGLFAPKKIEVEKEMETKRDEETERPCRILVVEDDAEMRSLLVSSLKKEGYELLEANDGSEFLEIVSADLSGNNRLCDIIISDIRMPGYTGLECLERMNHAILAIPVIFITAFGDDETHSKAKELGAVAVMDKPFEMNDLKRLIKEICSSTPS